METQSIPAPIWLQFVPLVILVCPVVVAIFFVVRQSRRPPVPLPIPMAEKHSRLGIASFVISVAVAFLMVALIFLAWLMHGNGASAEKSIVGISMILLLFADMGGAGLGIAAVCQSERKRMFGILGLAFSLLTVDRKSVV